jgi:hypothetical protein
MWQLLLFPYLAWGCTNTTTLIEESYLACQVHAECGNSFYLTPAHHFWEASRFEVLVGIVLNSIAVNATTICNSTESFAVWMELLGSWDFCRENEVYSEKTQDCVCSPDKNCDPTMYGTLGGSTTVEWIVVILLTLIFMYWCKHVLQELQKLHSIRKKKTLVEHMQ